MLNVHKILDSQTVRNNTKFHILDKSENCDNRFLKPDLDLEIFFPILNPSFIEKKYFHLKALKKKIIYLWNYER